MFKPLTRYNKHSHRSNGEFAETMFVHTAGDDDYSGFAPTEMFPEDDLVPLSAPASADAARAAASTSRTALERAAAAPVPAMAPRAQAVEESSAPQSWVTSQWVAAQAHEAAPGSPRTGLARLRAAFERLLPGEFRSLLPLFIGVTVTVALISAVLPLFDKP